MPPGVGAAMLPFRLGLAAQFFNFAAFPPPLTSTESAASSTTGDDLLSPISRSSGKRQRRISRQREREGAVRCLASRKPLSTKRAPFDPPTPRYLRGRSLSSKRDCIACTGATRGARSPFSPDGARRTLCCVLVARKQTSQFRHRVRQQRLARGNRCWRPTGAEFDVAAAHRRPGVGRILKPFGFSLSHPLGVFGEEVLYLRGCSGDLDLFRVGSL